MWNLNFISLNLTLCEMNYRQISHFFQFKFHTFQDFHRFFFYDRSCDECACCKRIYWHRCRCGITSICCKNIRISRFGFWKRHFVFWKGHFEIGRDTLRYTVLLWDIYFWVEKIYLETFLIYKKSSKRFYLKVSHPKSVVENHIWSSWKCHRIGRLRTFIMKINCFVVGVILQI